MIMQIIVYCQISALLQNYNWNYTEILSKRRSSCLPKISIHPVALPYTTAKLFMSLEAPSACRKGKLFLRFLWCDYNFSKHLLTSVYGFDLLQGFFYFICIPPFMNQKEFNIEYKIINAFDVWLYWIFWSRSQDYFMIPNARELSPNNLSI